MSLMSPMRSAQYYDHHSRYNAIDWRGVWVTWRRLAMCAFCPWDERTLNLLTRLSGNPIVCELLAGAYEHGYGAAAVVWSGKCGCVDLSACCGAAAATCVNALTSPQPADLCGTTSTVNSACVLCHWVCVSITRPTSAAAAAVNFQFVATLILCLFKRLSYLFAWISSSPPPQFH